MSSLESYLWSGSKMKVCFAFISAEGTIGPTNSSVTLLLLFQGSAFGWRLCLPGASAAPQHLLEHTTHGWGGLGTGRRGGACQPVLWEGTWWGSWLCGSVWERAGVPSWGAVKRCPRKWSFPGGPQWAHLPRVGFVAHAWHCVLSACFLPWELGLHSSEGGSPERVLRTWSRCRLCVGSRWLGQGPGPGGTGAQESPPFWQRASGSLRGTGRSTPLSLHST